MPKENRLRLEPGSVVFHPPSKFRRTPCHFARSHRLDSSFDFPERVAVGVGSVKKPLRDSFAGLRTETLPKDSPRRWNPETLRFPKTAFHRLLSSIFETGKIPHTIPKTGNVVAGATRNALVFTQVTEAVYWHGFGEMILDGFENTTPSRGTSRRFRRSNKPGRGRSLHSYESGSTSGALPRQLSQEQESQPKGGRHGDNSGKAR